MHKYVCFNGNIERARETFISAAASAALYGKGVFTTVAVYDGKPFLWEKHWRRLIDNAARLRINLSEFPAEAIKNSLAGLLEKNGCADGRARITFYDESASRIWNYSNARAASFLITTADRRATKADFHLGVSPYAVNSTSPLAGVKSCNYLENVLALEEAATSGLDEAIRRNERGEIASACMANIFWLKDAKLFTPALETGCLPGTTRELLMETCETAQVREGIETLENADAIFLTSSGIGVKPIARFGDQTFERRFEEITGVIDRKIRRG